MWLCRLHKLQIPFTYAPPGEDGATVGEELKPRSIFRGRGQTDAHRVTENLIKLKLTEMCLRHERSSVFGLLRPEALNLLDTARRIPLEPPAKYQMPEFPFVFAELGCLFRAVGLFLHPTLYGPYRLDLTDPVGRVVVEWDASWRLYPLWR